MVITGFMRSHIEAWTGKRQFKLGFSDLFGDVLVARVYKRYGLLENYCGNWSEGWMIHPR